MLLMHALVIPLPYLLGQRVPLGNDLAGLLGGNRGAIHIPQLVRPVFFEDGPDAIQQVGGTSTHLPGCGVCRGGQSGRNRSLQSADPTAGRFRHPKMKIS